MTFKKILHTTLYLVSMTFPVTAMAEDRALIVGINAYPEKPLAGCVTDARNISNMIQRVWKYKQKQIKMLLDKQATKEAILNAFDNWLIAGTRRGDRVIFYYSGHGFFMPDNNGDEDDGRDETICPVNASTDSRNMIRDDEIHLKMKKLSGRQVIFISDSCHSGTIARGFSGSRTYNPYLSKLLSDDPADLATTKRGVGRPETPSLEHSLANVITYSAVSPTQVALDGGPKGGIFTNAFIEGLEEKAADSNHDSKVTHQELLDYVRQQSQEHCDRTGSCQQNGGRLTPHLDADAKWLTRDVTAKDDSLPPPSPPNDVMHNNNPAQLNAQMLPSRTFRLGDKMQIQVNSQHTGYLFVLDIDANGKLTIIFPNDYSRKYNRSGLIEQGDTVTIPDMSYGFEFEAQEPTGEGILIALLIEESAEFVENFQQELPKPQRGFVVIEGTNKVQATLQQLRQKLNQTVVATDGAGRPVNWSMVDINYQIKR